VGVSIDSDQCENTGVCAQVCPEDVFEGGDARSRVVRAEACTYCWICVDHCVSGAIELD